MSRGHIEARVLVLHVDRRHVCETYIPSDNHNNCCVETSTPPSRVLTRARFPYPIGVRRYGIVNKTTYSANDVKIDFDQPSPISTFDEIPGMVLRSSGIFTNESSGEASNHAKSHNI